MICEKCNKITNDRFCFVCNLSNTYGISKITPRIYLTDYMSARNYEKLQELGIEQILTVGIDLEPHDTDLFKTCKINVSDVENENIAMYFNTTNNFIDQGITLVHCRAGISRSSSVVAAYLMKTNKWTANEALAYIQSKRTVINPNPGFLKQLKKYEKINSV